MDTLKRFAFVTSLSAILIMGAASASSVVPPGFPNDDRLRCTEVFFPIICDGGLNITHPCSARCAGATNCVPNGDF